MLCTCFAHAQDSGYTSFCMAALFAFYSICCWRSHKVHACASRLKTTWCRGGLCHVRCTLPDTKAPSTTGTEKIASLNCTHTASVHTASVNCTHIATAYVTLDYYTDAPKAYTCLSRLSGKYNDYVNVNGCAWPPYSLHILFLRARLE